MSHTIFCKYSNSSSRERSISLCECVNTKSCNLEFTESDDVEQDTVKSEKTKPSLWERILQETEDNMAGYRQWWEEKHSQEIKQIFQEGSIDYLNKEIFPLLLAALKDMLIEARKFSVLRIQKSRFNGIDFLAEKLWNQNPRHPERSTSWVDVFNIPPFKFCLKIQPLFPKSWIWTEDEAATIIQKYVREWLIRKIDFKKLNI